jgi:hypothetical protein
MYGRYMPSYLHSGKCSDLIFWVYSTHCSDCSCSQSLLERVPCLAQAMLLGSSVMEEEALQWLFWLQNPHSATVCSVTHCLPSAFWLHTWWSDSTDTFQNIKISYVLIPHHCLHMSCLQKLEHIFCWGRRQEKYRYVFSGDKFTIVWVEGLKS